MPAREDAMARPSSATVEPGRHVAEAIPFVRAPSWILLGVPALLLCLIAVVELSGVDRALFFQLNDLSGATGIAFWTHVTILGDGLVAAVLLLPWIRKHPERVWAGLLGAVVMVVVLRLFKVFLNLPRPLAVLGADAFVVVGPGHRLSAFPSGHAATIFLYVGLWIMNGRRARATLALLLPAAIVGLSRVVVGVHWPSDVLAGALLGWVAAWLGLRWARRVPAGIGPGRRIIAVALLLAAVILLLVNHTGYPGVVWFQRGIALLCLAWGGWEISAGFRAGTGEP
jgi:membrane-associated phospholipid phosphatase